MFVLLEGAACHESKVNIHCDSDVIGSSGNSHLAYVGRLQTSNTSYAPQ